MLQVEWMDGLLENAYLLKHLFHWQNFSTGLSLGSWNYPRRWHWLARSSWTRVGLMCLWPSVWFAFFQSLWCYTQALDTSSWVNGKHNACQESCTEVSQAERCATLRHKSNSIWIRGMPPNVVSLGWSSTRRNVLTDWHLAYQLCWCWLLACHLPWLGFSLGSIVVFYNRWALPAPISTASGVFQGCSLSLLCINLHMAIWALILRNVPQVKPFAFIDDSYIIGDKDAIPQLQLAVDLTRLWDNLTGPWTSTSAILLRPLLVLGMLCA